MEPSIIAALASGLTTMIGALIWGFRKWMSHRLALAKQKANGRKFSEQLIYHRYVKAELDKLRAKFEAQACLAAKFHNGQTYLDGQHILKWSLVLHSQGDQFREALQNRLTTDSPVFFGDLKEDGIAFSESINALKCDGMRRLLQSLGIKAFVAVLNDESFLFLLYTEEEQPQINRDQAQLIKQEFSTFAEYI